MNKTFYSLNVWKKYHLPKAYRKEMKERAIKKLGYGVWLAKQFLAEMRAKLRRI